MDSILLFHIFFLNFVVVTPNQINSDCLLSNAIEKSLHNDIKLIIIINTKKNRGQ